MLLRSGVKKKGGDQRHRQQYSSASSRIIIPRRTSNTIKTTTTTATIEESAIAASNFDTSIVSADLFRGRIEKTTAAVVLLETVTLKGLAALGSKTTTIPISNRKKKKGGSRARREKWECGKHSSVEAGQSGKFKSNYAHPDPPILKEVFKHIFPTF